MTDVIHRDTGTVLVRKPEPSSRIVYSTKAMQLAESFTACEEEAKALRETNAALLERLGKVETAFAMSQNDVKHLTERAERAETQLERYRNFANNLLARIKNAATLLDDLAAIRPVDFKASREEELEAARLAAIQTAMEQSNESPDQG